MRRDNEVQASGIEAILYPQKQLLRRSVWQSSLGVFLLHFSYVKIQDQQLPPNIQ